jgi:hypothetical protein
VWFRRGRLLMVSPDSRATACPPSGRNSTYRPVQISGTGSKIGGGYYVRATLPNGIVDRIEGFATEGDAGRWIKNESVGWLYEKSKGDAV